jgi:hypothetical protein
VLPDYKLKVMDKTTGQKAEVGAGWKNANGSISIQLNLCVALHPNPNQVLTLFPNDRKLPPEPACEQSQRGD